MDAGTAVAPAKGGPSQQSAGELQVVSFHVGEEEFGLDIVRVQEIIRMQPLTRVPNSPDFVEGVINLRGKVIPVLSLRKRFGLEGRAADKETRIVIVEIGGTVLGLVVDRVSEVMRLARDMVEAPPALHKSEREFVLGVARAGERLLIVVDVQRLVSGEESTAVEKMAAR